MSIKLRTQAIDGLIELKILLTHPMENGRNRNPINGELIPAHFIEQLMVELNGQPIMPMQLGPSISANPYFSVRLKRVAVGDVIRVSWRDNLGASDSREIRVEETNRD